MVEIRHVWSIIILIVGSLITIGAFILSAIFLYHDIQHDLSIFLLTQSLNMIPILVIIKRLQDKKDPILNDSADIPNGIVIDKKSDNSTNNIHITDNHEVPKIPPVNLLGANAQVKLVEKE
jgi:hypothetical protein